MAPHGRPHLRAVPAGRWHDYGPGSGVGVPEWPLGLTETCDAGWEHRGFGLVMGRPAHHLACGLDEFWVDEAWLLVTRTQHDPGPLGSQTSYEEILSVDFRPPPAELFQLPTRADVYCPMCPSPSPSRS